MKCPGCGGVLEPVTIDVLDNSYRCDRCKGFWVANWVVNNMAAGKEIQAVRSGLVNKSDQGTNKCPLDGTLLISLPKDVVPEGLSAGKCITCAGWWFPGDELFNFQTAMRTKENYIKQWHRKDWMTYAWPALVVGVLLVGIGGGVKLINDRQQASINASVGVSQFVPIIQGQGEAEIRFKTQVSVGQVEYKKVQDEQWQTVGISLENGWYVVRLSGLDKGQYIMRILEKDYNFSI